MSKIKSQLMNEINKKAKKIRDNRIIAANNKSLETAVFDFFKNIEDSRLVHNGQKYDPYLFDSAKQSLLERIKGFDPGSKVSVEFNTSDTPMMWNEHEVRGVTIWWSKGYIAKNNVDPSYFIDVSQMLFL